ncbi:MAG: bacterioferritin [Candidatus Schekmanbacteria bacterium]|nr:bacterioferritin [Candidatus Schekmanbacteria bacterium]
MDRSRSIELLNLGVADELQAVHQYMYFHFHLADQGYGRLSMLLKRSAIDEMGHIEVLSERILFLKGDVVLKAAAPVEPIRDPEAILRRAAEMESQAIGQYNTVARECAQLADSASKQIFERLVQDEERHFDLFDKQLEHIQRFGERYLALQSFDNTATQEGGGAKPE